MNRHGLQQQQPPPPSPSGPHTSSSSTGSSRTTAHQLWSSSRKGGVVAAAMRCRLKAAGKKGIRVGGAAMALLLAVGWWLGVLASVQGGGSSNSSSDPRIPATLLDASPGAAGAAGAGARSLLRNLDATVPVTEEAAAEHLAALPFVVVVLMPSPVIGPGTRAERIQAIDSTWGRSVPTHVKVLYATDDLASDHGGADAADPAADSSSSSVRPSVDEFLPFPPDLGSEKTDGLRRLGWVLAEALHRYPSSDFLMLGNDHTMVLPSNLLAYLADHHNSKTEGGPLLYLGNKLQIDSRLVFNSGGAGLVLSRAAVEVLLPALEEGGEGCVARNEWESTNAGEDRGERFNVYGPCRMAEGKVDEWYRQYHDYEGGDVQSGLSCCAVDTISFHYVGPAETRAIWHVLTHQDRYREDAWLREHVMEESKWPTKADDLGGYSRRPSPPGSDGGGGVMWDLLLDRVRLDPRVTITTEEGEGQEEQGGGGGGGGGGGLRGSNSSEEEGEEEQSWSSSSGAAAVAESRRRERRRRRVTTRRTT